MKVNADLASKPELVNEDCYGKAWMIVVAPTDRAAVEALMDAKAYGEYLKTAPHTKELEAASANRARGEATERETSCFGRRYSWMTAVAALGGVVTACAGPTGKGEGDSCSTNDDCSSDLTCQPIGDAGDVLLPDARRLELQVELPGTRRGLIAARRTR